MTSQPETATMPTGDRGRVASRALTEVRTVLSRARTARAALDRPTEPVRDEAGTWLRNPEGTLRYADDPDAPEMRAALDQVIATLEPWQRTGR